MVAWWAFNNQGFERLSQGNIGVLIRNGVIDVNELERTGLSQERLFAELRCNAISHLGEVERLYIEANGSFTLIKENVAVSGLSVLPIDDKQFLSEFEFDQEKQLCGFCGTGILGISEILYVKIVVEITGNPLWSL